MRIYLLDDILGMDATGFYFLCIIVIAVSLIVWYNIIRSATKSSSIMELNKMQVKLLKEIALKSGVTPEEVDKIIIKEYLD